MDCRRMSTPENYRSACIAMNLMNWWGWIYSVTEQERAARELKWRPTTDLVWYWSPAGECGENRRRSPVTLIRWWCCASVNWWPRKLLTEQLPEVDIYTKPWYPGSPIFPIRDRSDFTSIPRDRVGMVAKPLTVTGGRYYSSYRKDRRLRCWEGGGYGNQMPTGGRGWCPDSPPDLQNRTVYGEKLPYRREAGGLRHHFGW